MRLSWWNRFATRFLFSSVRRQADRRKATGSLKLCLELLETRELLSAASAVLAVPTYVLNSSHGSFGPLATSGPTGYTPAQIRQAYGFDQIMFSGVPGDGRGMTIAIVDAYDDPNMVGDLKAFDTQFGLPGNNTDNDMSFFTKVNQNGKTSPLPTKSGNTGWSIETSLDVEWAHAIAPMAKILLVEANSPSFGNLLTGVDTASNWPNVVAVSMSWGAGEFSGETSYDSHFTHANVTYLVSSGDSGAPDSYPSSSPNVVSVGGTTLKMDGTPESGWAGSGGGISAYESQPSYQNNLVIYNGPQNPPQIVPANGKRANPDVSYDSDPNTGFPVYDTYDFKTVGYPWAQFGGTSDAAPQWAGLIAIADQGRHNISLAPLGGQADTLPMLYSMPTTDFHDITSGTSTGNPNFTAATGYDLVTGLGSPYADRVVRDLVGIPVQQILTSVAVSPATATVADGATKQFTATALDQFGHAMATQPAFTWSVVPGAIVGAIDATGLYTAPSSGAAGTDIVQAAVVGGSLTATATVNYAVLPPTVTTPASAMLSSQGTSASLSVSATDPNPGATITSYSWAVSGPSGVTFSDNNSSTANNATAYLTHTGTYTFTVTITDSLGMSNASSVQLIVVQVLTNITVSPASIQVSRRKSFQFSASAYDQFGLPMTTTISWKKVSGSGSISSSGLYTASRNSGTAVIEAYSGSVFATATITIV